MCVNSASTVLRGAGDNGEDNVETYLHVVAACGKASYRKACLLKPVFIGETGLLDILTYEYDIDKELPWQGN